MSLFLILLYNISILAGTAYLVQFYDWSPWWFLLSGSCLILYSKK